MSLMLEVMQRCSEPSLKGEGEVSNSRMNAQKFVENRRIDMRKRTLVSGANVPFTGVVCLNNCDDW